MAPALELAAHDLGGNGPHLVMLHGWGHSSALVRSLGELLTTDFHVVLLDLPGFGASPEPPDEWGSAEYAHCVRENLAARGIERAWLFGHSFGGQVSVQVAARYPQHVHGLLLINSAGVRRAQSPAEARRSKMIAWLRNTVKLTDRTLRTKIFEKWFIPRFGSVDYRAAAGVMRKVLVKAVNEDLTSIIKTVQCPALLIWGEFDTATPLEAGRRFAAALHGSELVVLPDRGHVPFSGMGAHLCALIMLEWFRSRAAVPTQSEEMPAV